MFDPPVRARYDVVIAGARCAGAATALLLARHGLSVLVVDPLPRGRDTLSTHALMRGGILQLERWGLLDDVREAGTPAVRTTTFDYGDETIAVPIKAKHGVDALYAPRRTVLDPILVDAAVAAGADVVHGRAVVDLLRSASGRVEGILTAGAQGPARATRADLVIGADGVRSRVARLLRAPVELGADSAAACIFGYFSGIPREDYRWSFRPGISTGTIPTNGGEHCVFVSVPAERFAGTAGEGLAQAYHELLRNADPELADVLAAATPASPLRAFAGMPGFLRQSSGPGWALVGDAGFFRDPITAHGITDAFRDAELLARAVLLGNDRAITGYQAARDEVARDILRVTDRIASFTWSMEEVKGLHHALNRAMNAGVDLVLGFDATVDTKAGAAA